MRVHKGKEGNREHIVSLSDVHMAFFRRFKKPVYALRGISLDIEEGSVLGLLGPNGSGKTTIISCILGLLKPQQGIVQLWGRQVDQTSLNTPRTIYGVLLEDTRLPPFLSVEEALKVTCELRGFSGLERGKEMDRVVSAAGVEALLTRRIAVLSKGQSRRVGVAAALVGDPSLMLLDEPSAGLDVASRLDFDELIRKLADGKRTILIASHLLSDVQNTCSDIVIVRDGKVVVSGSAAELLATAEKGSARSNIFVEEKHADTLKKLGVSFEPSNYKELVLIRTDRADQDILSVLLKEQITPRRMMPRVDLVSVYLDFTREEDDS